MQKCWFNTEVGSVQYCFDFMQTAGDGHGKGLQLLAIGKRGTKEAVWFMPVIKSGVHARNGIMVNNCPFCGTRLDTLVAKEKRAAHA